MAKTPDEFSGKTIIVTGAASGVGRSTALVFAREGANVVCADLDGEGAARTANQVIQTGGQAEAATTDVTSRAAVEAMCARAVERFGRVHFILNAAGAAMRRAAFLEIDDDLWDRTYDLNVKGTLYGMQAVLPHMLDQGGGVIVNIASLAMTMGGPGNSVHYASAKGAVNTMTLGVAREFADRGIRCLSISPGPLDTPFHDNTPRELLETYRASVPMGRFGTPEEIAELVLFLCSDACGFMTADTVFVTGGMGWR